MVEILHQLIRRISHDLPGFSTIPGGDRRISEPSTVVTTTNQANIGERSMVWNITFAWTACKSVVLKASVSMIQTWFVWCVKVSKLQGT